MTASLFLLLGSSGVILAATMSLTGLMRQQQRWQKMHEQLHEELLRRVEQIASSLTTCQIVHSISIAPLVKVDLPEEGNSSWTR